MDVRASRVSNRIRAERLIVVLRRIEPPERLTALVDELADAGVRVFEITMDGTDAAATIDACRRRLPDDCLVGAGTVRTAAHLKAALAAGADFGVSPILDHDLLSAATRAGLAFLPGAYSPTEVASAWAAGAAFVKLFPASSLGPSHVRELRGPLPDVQLIPTGGIDARNAAAFLAAGAVAVGIGSALTAADGAGRRAILDAVRGAP